MFNLKIKLKKKHVRSVLFGLRLSNNAWGSETQIMSSAAVVVDVVMGRDCSVTTIVIG